MENIFRGVVIVPILLLSGIHSGSPESGRSETEGYPVKVTGSAVPSASSLMEYDPYNVTISQITSRSVQVSWSCKSQNSHDKYEVTLKPLKASYRVIETVPYNTCYLYMDKLEPDSNYQVSVTSISGRTRRRSSSVIFRTYMEDYTDDIVEDGDDESNVLDPDDTVKGTSEEGKVKPSKDRLKLPRVRLVEISLVGMALILWAGAIVLFFHRWGKIRMLLPYQPDYKEMKRNNSICANCSMTPHHQCCRMQPVPHPPVVADCCGAVVGGSLPGPSTSLCHTPKPERTSVSVACVPMSDAGCSPIRPRLNSFMVCDLKDTRKDNPLLLQGPYRKTRSAEQLQHYHCSNPLPPRLPRKKLSFNNSSSKRSDTNSSSLTSTSTTPTITTSSTTPYLDECSIDMDLIYTDF